MAGIKQRIISAVTAFRRGTPGYDFHASYIVKPSAKDDIQTAVFKQVEADPERAAKIIRHWIAQDD